MPTSKTGSDPPKQAQHPARPPTSRSRSAPASQRPHIILTPKRQRAQNSSPNPSPAQRQRDAQSRSNETPPKPSDAQLPIWPFLNAQQSTAPALGTDGACGTTPAEKHEGHTNQPSAAEASPDLPGQNQRVEPSNPAPDGPPQIPQQQRQQQQQNVQENLPQSGFQFENLRDPTNGIRLRQSAATLPQAKRPRNNNQNPAEENLNGLLGTLILFSLFDGGGIARKSCEKLQIRPTAVIAAEEMIQLRAAVAEQYGYTAEPGAWSYDKERIPSTYLTDVWELFTEKDGVPSFVLQQALSFAEQAQHKYLIIGGSPCTDLTSASVHGGALGFCGKESFHYHVYPFLISAIQALDPQAQIFVLFENAASMKPMHTTYMHSVVKMPGQLSKKLTPKAFQTQTCQSAETASY